MSNVKQGNKVIESKELDVANEASHEAAELIQAYQQNRSFEINFKGRNDLVTDADVEAEQIIVDHIQNTFPDDDIIAEESNQQGLDLSGRNWIVDPIDGTTNYVHGFPVYCVSIAFWVDGKPEDGLVLEVNSGDIFMAAAGQGAFLNGERIHVSNIKDPQNAMIGTGFPYNKMSFTGAYLDLFEHILHHTQAVRRPGTAAYDLCCVAAGRYESYYEAFLNPWDIAAGALIVEEAGGVITDWNGNSDWLTNGFITAGNPHIHAFVLEAMKSKYHKA